NGSGASSAGATLYFQTADGNAYYCAPSMYEAMSADHSGSSSKSTDVNSAQRAARAGEQAEESAALRVLTAPPGPSETVGVQESNVTDRSESARAPESVVRAADAPAVLTASTREGQSSPSGLAASSSGSWFAALSLAATEDNEKNAPAPSDEGGALLARETESGEAPSRPGALIAGVAPLDLAALEHGVARFFEHLQEQGRGLTTQPGVDAMTSLLTASAAATAAFELARRLNRLRLAGAAVGLNWREE